MAGDGDGGRPSIYSACRKIKRRESSMIYNALRSIYEDSVFVSEIAAVWPSLPVAANLRCGAWYASRFDATCYFKSTDGHAGNWSFSTLRLNLHLAHLAGRRGGCLVVDSTRKGKRFPDSMSKTIPIWTCILNRAVHRHQRRTSSQNSQAEDNMPHDMWLSEWDTSLHLPLWVSSSERTAINGRLEEWTTQLEDCGADIYSLAALLRKPLRPLWISQKTLIWLNEVPEYDSWDFTPIILLSASSTDVNIQQRTGSEFSWHYIPGAGDDEESWARGLTPDLFWKNAYDLIDCGPDLCNQKVAEIIERERVYCAQRGEFAPQVAIKQRMLRSSDSISYEIDISTHPFKHYEVSTESTNVNSDEESSFSWIGSTNLAISSNLDVGSMLIDINCILDCSGELKSFGLSNDAYLCLPIMMSKMERFSVISHLPAAFGFAKACLSRGKRILISCHNGKDISVCVCLAIFAGLFDERGVFDDGKCFLHSSFTKFDLRRRLVFICKYAVNAMPSRGNLRQVFGFLGQLKRTWDDDEHDSSFV